MPLFRTISMGYCLSSTGHSSHSRIGIQVILGIVLVCRSSFWTGRTRVYRLLLLHAGAPS